MKITQIQTELVRIPFEEPLANASDNPNGTRTFVIVTLRTDDGLEGIGLTTFGGGLSGVLKMAVEQLGALVIGEDPTRPEKIAHKLESAAGTTGPGGIFTLACAPIDMALWDIKAKAANVPLWRLLGGARERVPTYASGAMARGLTLDRVLESAATLKAKGFRQAKMQLALPGETSTTQELERAKKVSEIFGPDFNLMCDINQRWRVDQAIQMGHRLQDQGVHFFWLEDMTTPDDFIGLSRIATSLATPLAGGEYLYGITPFHHMIQAGSVDIIMIDLCRVGGITPWLKVAAMAEAANLPVVSHLLPEIHVHLISAIPNGLTVEFMPWSMRLYEEIPQPVNGELTLPSAPGLGLKFKQDIIKRYRVT